MVRDSAVEAVAALLEVTASEHPELLDYQAHVLLNSSMRHVIHELAAALDVPLERVGVTVYQACLDLDQLERRRAWREPAEVVESPNLAALCYVCRARAGRVQGPTRRRRLQGTLRKLERAYDRDGYRKWIVAFIGRSRADRSKAARADG